MSDPDTIDEGLSCVTPEECGLEDAQQDLELPAESEPWLLYGRALELHYVGRDGVEYQHVFTSPVRVFVPEDGALTLVLDGADVVVADRGIEG